MSHRFDFYLIIVAYSFKDLTFHLLIFICQNFTVCLSFFDLFWLNQLLFSLTFTPTCAGYQIWYIPLWLNCLFKVWKSNTWLNVHYSSLPSGAKNSCSWWMLRHCSIMRTVPFRWKYHLFQSAEKPAEYIWFPARTRQEWIPITESILT